VAFCFPEVLMTNFLTTKFSLLQAVLHDKNLDVEEKSFLCNFIDSMYDEGKINYGLYVYSSLHYLEHNPGKDLRQLVATKNSIMAKGFIVEGEALLAQKPQRAYFFNLDMCKYEV
jgi:hypothetical protein